MNRFRSSRHGSADDDPTETLRVWRDQQDRERLADTREFPEPVGPADAPRRGRRVPLLVVAGVGVLVVGAGVAIASAASRPSDQGTSGGVVTTAPASPSDTPSGADAGSTPAGPDDAPPPPDGGPGAAGVGTGPDSGPPAGPGAPGPR